MEVGLLFLLLVDIFVALILGKKIFLQIIRLVYNKKRHNNGKRRYFDFDLRFMNDTNIGRTFDFAANDYIDVCHNTNNWASSANNTGMGGRMTV